MADYKVSITAQLQGFEAIQAKLNALEGDPINVKIKADQSGISDLTKQYQTGGSKAGMVYGQAFSKNLTDATKSSGFKNFAVKQAKQTNDMVNATKNAQKVLADSGNKVTEQQAKNIVKNYSKEIDNAAKVAQKQTEARMSAMDKLNKGYYDLDSAKAESTLSKFSKGTSASTQQLYKDYDDFIAKDKAFKNAVSSGSVGEDDFVKIQEARNNALEKFNVTSKIATTQMSQTAKESTRFAKANVLEKYAANNTRMGADNRQKLQGWANQLRNGATVGDMENINSQFNSLKGNLEATGKTGKSIFSELGRGFKQIGQFALTYGGIQKGIQTVQQMASEVVKVDSAMIELRKVSDASDADIQNYLGDATASAKTYGSTIDDVISNTADWSRMGYSLPDAKTLSDATTLYQKVGDNMTQESASASMISTLQGFQLDASQAEHIVNSFNEVGNNFAIGSDGIGEALQRSSASLNAAGNTMEESIGLVTAANEVVQDPASVGKWLADVA